MIFIKFWYICDMAIIDPRHLVQFHEIIRTGSFTRAAETLGLTQPALTRNMKVMEGRLGFEVLVRSRQRILPTVIGVRILEEAKSVVLAERRISELTDNFGETTRQILRIGCTPSATLPIMAEPLKQFAQQMPKTGFDVQSASGTALAAALANGKIELAIGPMDIADKLPNAAGQVFFDSQMIIIAAHQHPLARRAKVNHSDLKDQRWALSQPGTHIRGLSDRILDGMGLGGENAAVTALPTELVLPFLEMGDHLGIMPHYRLVETGDRFLRIRTAGIKFSFGATWQAGAKLSVPALRFVQLMETQMRGFR